MKKAAAVTFIIAAVIVAVMCVGFKDRGAQADTEYLRIHVRANSNSEYDQKIKYEVKDEIVKFITPYVAACTTKSEAMEKMRSITGEIAEVADGALKKRGINYGARASVRAEKFPTRVYGDITLDEGVYDALIVELGTGGGDNWWCVIYPPLCFTSASADVSYRSAIADVINKWKAKRRAG